MESLSPSQIRDINSLYSKMYEPEGELVERYLSEDEIRLNYAYALSESKNDYSDEQLSAVVEIMTEMTLNMQRGEQAISKILGEEIILSETVGVLEDKENLQEFKKTLMNLTGYGLKGQRGKIMKFLSNRVANKNPLVNPIRAVGSIRRNITNALGVNFANQADDATGGNVKGTIANTAHGVLGQLNPMHFIRAYQNKKTKVVDEK